MSDKPTLLQHAAAWSQLVPPVVAVAAGRVATPARRWIIVWCLLLVASDAIALTLGAQGINNLWVTYTAMPITGAVVLWALAHWQVTGIARLTLRAAIPIFIAVSILLTLVLENPQAYSLVAAPFHYLVLLLAALWTFIRLSLGETGRLTQRDWFWTTIGLILYSGTATALQPVGSYLVAHDQDLLHAALNVKAAADVLAFGAITGGMLCPLPQTSSGGSS